MPPLLTESGVHVGRSVQTDQAAGWDSSDGAYENGLLQGSEGSTVRVEVSVCGCHSFSPWMILPRIHDRSARRNVNARLTAPTVGVLEWQVLREGQLVALDLRRRSFRTSKYPALRVQTLIDSQGHKIAYVRLHKFDRPATAQLMVRSPRPVTACVEEQ
jgi:hypothetical protein